MDDMYVPKTKATNAEIQVNRTQVFITDAPLKVNAQAIKVTK